MGLPDGASLPCAPGLACACGDLVQRRIFFELLGKRASSPTISLPKNEGTGFASLTRYPETMYHASRIERTNRVVQGRIRYETVEQAEDSLRVRFPDCLLEIAEEVHQPGDSPRFSVIAARPPHGKWIRLKNGEWLEGLSFVDQLANLEAIRRTREYGTERA